MKFLGGIPNQILARVPATLLSLAALAGATMAAAQTLDEYAYFGDSQVVLGGISHGLTCLDRDHIVAYGNASATTYIGGGRCRLFGSFRRAENDGRDLCPTAQKNFTDILSTPTYEIGTVVVGLGDNISSKSAFTQMLTKIRGAGKKCVWVMPAQKDGDNRNTELAIRALRPVAERLCGRKNIINPSADHKAFRTRRDQVHYDPSAGREIGLRVCRSLIEIARAEKATTPAGRPESPAKSQSVD